MPQVMRFTRMVCANSRSRVLAWITVGALALTLQVEAAQLDIAGPSGSAAFGKTVVVLPNGNFVVTDPDASASAVGAVYLYAPTGALISTLTGSSTNDHVGSGGVFVVGNGNFLVRSPKWNNGGAAQAGAVTWVNGSTGLSGVVSASNSLVGTTAMDLVGGITSGITVLSNGNYVVSGAFNNGMAAGTFGSVTWGDGNSGVTGPVSSANSLVGSTASDSVGLNGAIALANGNYVVASPVWNNGPVTAAGAVTWGDGNSGITGPVSASNSLVGTKVNDMVGWGGSNGIKSVTALTNGNYVVCSSEWSSSTTSRVGAATWGDGSVGIVGPVSASNSLVGTTALDSVGLGGVTALSNGNYVVISYGWTNGAASAAGAVTWGDGSSGITGPVSASNSLVGSTTSDNVGFVKGVTALSNGNYVVKSYYWSSPTKQVGAVTWGNGSSGITGPVSAGNSLVGTTAYDNVGEDYIAALSNGNYVVSSYRWSSPTSQVGAVTWGNGSIGITGPVSAGNSLVGTTALDNVSNGGIVALSNGNYVVDSFFLEQRRSFHGWCGDLEQWQHGDHGTSVRQ